MSQSKKQRADRGKEAVPKMRPTGPIASEPEAFLEEPDLLALQRTLADPTMANAAETLALQRRYGNRAVQGQFTQAQSTLNVAARSGRRTVTDPESSHAWPRQLQRKIVYKGTADEVALGSLMLGEAETKAGRAAIMKLGKGLTLGKRKFTHAGVYAGDGEIYEFWEKKISANRWSEERNIFIVLQAPDALNWYLTKDMLDHLKSKVENGQLKYNAFQAWLASKAEYKKSDIKKHIPKESYCVDVVAMAYARGWQQLKAQMQDTLRSKMGVADIYNWARNNNFGEPKLIEEV